MVYKGWAKNSYFKWIAQQGNFKNVELSDAYHYQKLMCALLHWDDFFDTAMVKSKLMLCVDQTWCITLFSSVYMAQYWHSWINILSPRKYQQY